MDRRTVVVTENVVSNNPDNPLGGCIDELLEANVTLEMTGWEVTLWDPGEPQVDAALDSPHDSSDEKVSADQAGAQSLQNMLPASNLVGGVRLYPTQLALDAKFGDRNPKCVAHWSYDMSQPAQIRWYVDPVFPLNAPGDVTVGRLRIGSLYVPKIGRTLEIEVSRSSYLIDPSRGW